MIRFVFILPASSNLSKVIFQACQIFLVFHASLNNNYEQATFHSFPDWWSKYIDESTFQAFMTALLNVSDFNVLKMCKQVFDSGS